MLTRLIDIIAACLGLLILGLMYPFMGLLI